MLGRGGKVPFPEIGKDMMPFLDSFPDSSRSVYFPSYKIRKLETREVKLSACSYPAGKWQSQVLNLFATTPCPYTMA